MKGMAFQTLAELMIIVLVLGVVVILISTQFIGLGRDTNKISQSASSSVNSSINVQGAALCAVSDGECLALCENDSYATIDHQGGCPNGYFCCAKT